MFLNSFSNFKAIAIILIVASHTYYTTHMIAGQHITISNQLLQDILISLIKGSTSIFAFISGFMFHHVSLKHYQYKKFIYGKFKRLVIPYLIVSIPALIYFTFLKQPAFHADYMDFTSDEWGKTILFYISTGKHLIPYWYIPFITALFILSPLLVKFTKIRLRSQLIVTTILLGVALIIHRPEYNIGLLHNIAYFIPIFFIGIISSQNKDEIYKKLHNKEWLLILLIAALTYINILYPTMKHLGDQFIFDYIGIDWWLLQKIAICFFLMVILNRFEDVECKWITHISEVSFPIYFLHPYFIIIIEKLMDHFLPAQYKGNTLWLLDTIIVIILSVITVVIIRKIFGKRSRLLVGA